jgi:2-hydroxy-3-keto-5-methylthiopentenyl-1-phosphate phosphatase
MAIPLPGGRSIATSMQMPADLANNSDGLLTQTDNIDRILSGYTANLTTAVKDTTSAASPTTRAGSTDFIGVLASKMDELLSKMKDNTNLQSELLALSKR